VEFRAELERVQMPEYTTHENILPTETFVLEDGLNVIQLCASFGGGIIINEKPLAYTWPDCAGSIGRYYFYCHDDQKAPLSEQRSPEIKQFQLLAEKGILAPDEPIAGQIMPLLRCSQTGNTQCCALNYHYSQTALQLRVTHSTGMIYIPMLLVLKSPISIVKDHLSC
jgi:hypothetical protein